MDGKQNAYALWGERKSGGMMRGKTAISTKNSSGSGTNPPNSGDGSKMPNGELKDCLAIAAIKLLNLSRDLRHFDEADIQRDLLSSARFILDLHDLRLTPADETILDRMKKNGWCDCDLNTPSADLANAPFHIWSKP